MVCSQESYCKCYDQIPVIAILIKLLIIGLKFKIHEDFITAENKNFIKEVIHDRMKVNAIYNDIKPTSDSPLINAVDIPKVEWNPKLRRTGVIAKKIGAYPMWQKDGTRILTTLLQVLGMHDF
jgi:large subunit ribosomal protein L3